jgi:hypothetical protein
MVTSIAVDPSNNVYIAGYTAGNYLVVRPEHVVMEGGVMGTT